MRIMIYPSMTQAMTIWRVVNARLGLPRRDHLGGPPVAVEGEQARGWTTAECSLLPATDDSGEVAMLLTEAAYALSGQPGTPQLDFSGYVTELPPNFQATVRPGD